MNTDPVLAALAKQAERAVKHHNRFRRYKAMTITNGMTANIHTHMGMFSIDTVTLPVLVIPRGWKLVPTADPSLFMLGKEDA